MQPPSPPAIDSPANGAKLFTNGNNGESLGTCTEGIMLRRKSEIMTSGRLLPLLPRLLLLLALGLNSGCDKVPEPLFQGYAEGEFIQVAAPLAGRLEHLAVARGGQVAVGALLFSLEHAAETAAVEEARHQVRQAEDRLADLLKGERPSELAALAARLAQAREARDLSRIELERRQQLFESKTVSAEERDRARTTFRLDQAAVAELEAQLQTARLGARRDQVAAARAEAEASRARLEQARWALEQKSQSAPAAALVFDTLYEEGEFVPAAFPVVTLLSPGNLKVRFFVPERLVGTLRPGQPVTVDWDGAVHPLTATISFISPQAEYTPPVIFSRETRAKLVFMVEAWPEPEQAERLHPGQPVEVRLE